MTLHGHRQPRRRPAGLQRWLLGIGTLLLALGVVVMHSLGIGHHGSIHPAPGDRPAVTAGAVVAHEVAGHDAMVLDPTVTNARHPASHSEGHSASHRASHGASHDTAAYGSMVAERAVAAAAGMSHGATVMCVAVLPLLVLLRRRGGRAWFARAVGAARRPVASLPAASWSAGRPRRPGSILSELCILRT